MDNKKSKAKPKTKVKSAKKFGVSTNDITETTDSLEELFKQVKKQVNTDYVKDTKNKKTLTDKQRSAKKPD